MKLYNVSQYRACATAAMMDVYRFDGKEWKMFPLADNEERIADITLTKDSTSIIAMTRSAVYEISGKKTDAANEKRDAISKKTNITRKIIGQPEAFVPEVTLFFAIYFTCLSYYISQ